ncbi:hypothetical protein Vadar_032229 [Vaccinium darrowii]|uniref:Uncharacterized protein n=1 Tax=Vaccinium darrowii TaxID=229202 RepID=A0ACB7XLE9_9ERIC|nr:hypothetical protein Vadar_032229 [Vaccinium darrowii]
MREKARKWAIEGQDDNDGWTVVSRRNQIKDRVTWGQSTISIFVDNLPDSMDEEWLAQIFKPYEDVKQVVIPKKRSKFNTIFGFVRYSSRGEANYAVKEMNGVEVRGHKVHAKEASFLWSVEAKQCRSVRRKGTYPAT